MDDMPIVTVGGTGDSVAAGSQLTRSWSFVSIEGRTMHDELLQEIRNITAEPPQRTDDYDLEEQVYAFLRGESVPGMTQEKVDKFLIDRKKVRHLNSSERHIYHKPKADGKLLTSKVDLSDVLT